MADFQNIGGFPKYWQISKILADFQNIGGQNSNKNEV
jgi:hypothetical protein